MLERLEPEELAEQLWQFGWERVRVWNYHCISWDWVNTEKVRGKEGKPQRSWWEIQSLCEKEGTKMSC